MKNITFIKTFKNSEQSLKLLQKLEPWKGGPFTCLCHAPVQVMGL